MLIVQQDKVEKSIGRASSKFVEELSGVLPPKHFQYGTLDAQGCHFGAVGDISVKTWVVTCNVNCESWPAELSCELCCA